MDSKLNTFKQLFQELLKDLACIKPGDPSLTLVMTAVDYCAPGVLQEQFSDCVGPYKEKILVKDEAFFLEAEDLAGEESDSFTLSEINRIKGIWKDKNTSEEDKECIWKYLILLVKLSDKIDSKKK